MQESCQILTSPLVSSGDHTHRVVTFGGVTSQAANSEEASAQTQLTENQIVLGSDLYVDAFNQLQDAVLAGAEQEKLCAAL